MIRAVVAAAVALALAGCGTSIRQRADALRSWSGVALATARAWQAHEVPTAYARRTLDTAHDEVARIAQSLHGGPQGEDDRRAALRAEAQALADALAGARQAVAADASGLSGAIAKLDASVTRLREVR